MTESQHSYSAAAIGRPSRTYHGQRLPSNVRMVLASADTTDLAKLADMADKIVPHQLLPQPPLLSRRYNSSRQRLPASLRWWPHSTNAALDLPAVAREIAVPKAQLAPTLTPLCWYHKKFGKSRQEALQLGKRIGRTLAVTGVTSPTSSRLFFVSTLTQFLVDTGSEVSVIPPTPADRSRSLDPRTLMAVNNTPIRTYGQRSLTLNLGLRRSLPWIFTIADVQKAPISSCTMA